MTAANDFLSFMRSQKYLDSAHRPLRLLLAFPDGVRNDVLLPQRVNGVETICGGFTYKVLALSISAELPLKEFIALPAEIEFVTDRGDIRRMCGIVAEASVGNSDGGVTSYQLVIRDVFALMERRVNSRIFRAMNELEVLDALFSEWRQNNAVLAASFDFEIDPVLLSRDLPQREMICQHNESDADFARRLMKRRGIAWFFRAGAPSTGTSRSDANRPSHTLVLFDDAHSLKQNKAGTVRFHRDDGTEQRDTISAWSGVRTLQPGQVSRFSWDYRKPGSGTFMNAEVLSQVDQGPTGNKFAASLDDYLVEMPHMGNDYQDYCALGEVRMARHDYEAKCFRGEGSVRDFCVGEYITLTGHPEIDTHPKEERDFVITELRVLAVNNLPSNLAEKAERLFERNRWDAERLKAVAAISVDSGIRSRNEFTAVRRGIPIVPAYDPRKDLPQMQMQSAIVVGPEGEEVHCDKMGRVKIRFPAMRASDHEHARGVGASDTDADSAWVRVASNWAGNGPGSQHQCGALGLPRVGTEVLVSFLGGDPDKPVIVGQVYNERAVPPGISEAGALPGNRYLSGLRSREVGGSRANRLRLDDTPGQISAQLKSDHGHSELNLGWLTQPRAEGKGVPRGEGAELRSDRAVSVRGGEGVLISATASAGGKGPQLERGELVGMVEVFLSVAEELAKLATLHKSGEADGPHLPRLLEKLKQWDTGTNVSTGASQGSPVIAASAPGGIVVASQDNLALGAESKIDVVSVGSTEVSSGKDISVRAAHSINLFAHQLGMKLIAASGNVAIQAHNGDIELTTPGRIKLHAGQGIELQAPEVKIVAQGAQADFGGGAITQQSSGPHAIKSSTFSHTKPGGASPPGVNFPSSGLEADERLILFDQSTGKPIAGRRYRLDLEDGRVISGVTDDQGRTELATSNAMGKVDFTIFPAGQQSES
jgi:type VI secretion system secreted protein VgrG